MYIVNDILFGKYTKKTAYTNLKWHLKMKWREYRYKRLWDSLVTKIILVFRQKHVSGACMHIKC